MNTAVTNTINLAGLQNGPLAFTPEYGAILAEAAAVCLENQGHSSGVALKVQKPDVPQGTFALLWFQVTPAMQACWNDLQYATEHGAYGIALLIMQKLTGLNVVERSRKGTGFDFWLGDTSSVLFQEKVRLEVSGILHGDTNTINARVKAKRSQIQRSGNSLPGYVVVVEFSKPVTQVSNK